MQKIMFNDRFNLTDLVLSGQKTQTRRIIKPQDERLDYLRGWNLDWGFAEFGRAGEEPLLRILPHYYVGEEVAVAQSYRNVMVFFDECLREGFFNTLKKELCGDPMKTAGWTNKMFIKPDLMPHRIRIKQIRLERLQDISDEDCMREGIRDYEDCVFFENFSSRGYNNVCYYSFLRDAFADLINRISGKGTWESNPYVWVYDFELVK